LLLSSPFVVSWHKHRSWTLPHVYPRVPLRYWHILVKPSAVYRCDNPVTLRCTLLRVNAQQRMASYVRLPARSCAYIRLTRLSIGQDRIVITSENMSSWLVNSPIAREISPQSGEWRGNGLGEKLQLQPGDVAWIGKQRDRLEVRAFIYPLRPASLKTPF
jgi:hypothetical protein